jgi:membrane protein
VRDAIHQLAPSHQLQNLVDTVLGRVKDPGTAGLAAIISIVAAF